MPKADVTIRSPIPKTFRTAKVQGMFDIPAQAEQVLTFTADLTQCDTLPWSVGAIVGASGRGKSTLARALWPDEYIPGAYDWSADDILDDFPTELGVQQITSALTTTGFSSSPAWLRPYRVLSTGEKHRADLARALCVHGGLVVVDEFTSVVDRTVAKAVSVAVSKHARRNDMQFVAVTCHRDVLDWLEIDWYYDADDGLLHWGRKRRPPIALEVREGSRNAWPRFRGYHYMSADIHKSARVFLGFVTLDGDEHLAGFFSILPSAGHVGWWRGHRTVVLPDYQGLGIGNKMIEITAEQLWRRERKRFRATTSSPPLVAHRRRHPEMWKLVQAPGMRPPKGKTGIVPSSAGRLTTSWAYLPEALR